MEELRNRIRESQERIGALYPIIIDAQGRIVDGETRYFADKTWPKVRAKWIKTDEDWARARLHANIMRKSPDMVADDINQVAKVLSATIPKGKLVKWLTQETGYSEASIRAMLLPEFKDERMAEIARKREAPPGGEAPKAVPAREPPKRGRPPKSFTWECPSCRATYEFFGSIRGFRPVGEG